MRILTAVVLVFIAGCHHGPREPEPWAHVEVYFSNPQKPYDVVGPIYAYANNEQRALNWLRKGTYEKFGGNATAVIVHTMNSRLTGATMMYGNMGVYSNVFVTGDAIRFR